MTGENGRLILLVAFGYRFFEITPYITVRTNITVTAQFDLNTIQSKSQYRFPKQACVCVFGSHCRQFHYKVAASYS